MGHRLRFHWSLAPSDIRALENAAQGGIFESVMLEPALTAPGEIAAALEIVRAIPQLTLMVPFRYDAMPVEQFRADIPDSRIVWLLACARLPFASRGSTPAPPEWYRDSDRFLREMNALWSGCRPARLHVYGNTSEAAVLAIKYGDCLWRFPAGSEDIYSHALPILHFGKEVGLVASLVARPSREDALEAIRPGRPGTLLEWTAPNLCRSAEWPLNAPILAGSYEDAAATLLGWKRLGISQVLFAAPRGEQEIEHFRRGVLPLTREKETAGCRPS
jgi:hypothetical protein